MTRARRWIVIVIGLALTLLGAATLNYNAGHNVEHHRAFAAEKDIPPPSSGLFYAGGVFALGGAGIIGFAIARQSAP